MKAVELRHGAVTDVGLVRTVNEDAFLAVAPVFLVADGMGGHSGGDVASQIAAEEFAALAERGYDPQRGEDHVADAVTRAQARLLAYADAQRVANPTWHAGTTLVAALLVELDAAPHWLVANLGDSRAYALSEGQLTQLTRDHSVVQELVDAGAISAQDAEHHPERHVITRALGSRSGAVPDYFVVPLSRAPRLLLCSDGVSGMITDSEIHRLLLNCATAESAATALVAAAVAAGGRDNATALVVDVVGLASSHLEDSARFGRADEASGGAGK